MTEMITVPFRTVLITFTLLSIVMIAFNIVIKKQANGTNKVSSKLVVLIEMFFGFFSNIVKETMGEEHVENFTPLAVTMFCSIFVGNTLVLIGFQEAATDIMFPLTWALSMFTFWNLFAIYKVGIKGYIGGFFSPVWWLFPLAIIEFVTKPLTLMIRMFGNIVSGFAMMAIVLAIPPLMADVSQALGLLGIGIIVPIAAGLSFFFSVFAPFIQAMVFTYLVFVNIASPLNEEE